MTQTPSGPGGDAGAVDPLLVATAAEAVLHAGAMQHAHFGTDVQVDKKGVIDLVTQVDLEVERWFRDMIGERFPSHAILAEELDDRSDAPERPTHCWVFDPIDGTVNYAHGLPIFCASLALEIDGVPTVAAVYDPMREELFTAELGAGARLNGVPLRVSTTSTLVDGMLCTGFPYDVHETVDEVIGLFGAFVAEARAVRRLGSAALDLCYVAAGRFDGFWEQRLHPWDMAAGALLVTEAGGTVSTMAGAPFDSREGSVVATNGPLHEAMLATIRGRSLQRTG
jgi:myo-inositol-1(or 4)-monophosphatase